MCARSEAKLRAGDVEVYMGYYGGYISIGEKKYISEDCIRVNKHDILITKPELMGILRRHKKKELCEMIVELIDNADED